MLRTLIFPVLIALLFSSAVVAQDAVIEQSAAEDTKAAEQELKVLEQTVGEDANDLPDTGPTAGNETLQKSGADTPDKDEITEDQVDEEQAEEELTEQEQAQKDEASSKPWLPAAKEFDWIQLTSGEWLKGEIKAMYNNSLEFDSDKLDLLSIDWEDVKYLKSYRPSTINVEYQEPLTGSLQISDDKVTIRQDDALHEFDRDDLISLTPAGNRELDLWAIKFTLSLNLKTGNTRQVDYTSKLNLKRRTARSRFILDYIGNISKTGDDNNNLTETVNNHRINASHSVYTSRYFFYQPIFAEYYRDPFQNIDQRLTAGVGLGYTLFDTGRFEWDIHGGPAYVRTRYISVQPGEDQKIDGPALVLGTTIDAELNGSLDFIFKYNTQIANKDSGGYTHHMIATFESEITGSLDLDVSFIWDRIGQPTKDDQGNVPKPDDYRLAVGVTYTY
jgi:hypothetical protein